MVIGVALLVAGAIFASIGFVAGTTLEERDTFCASCHTVPESTYFDRSTTALTNVNSTVSDLATAHYRQAQTKNQDFSCIRCHRGNASLGDRLQTLALGARDTLIFISGKADSTIEKTTVDQSVLVNTACVSCHEATMLTFQGIQNHFHNFLPQTGELLAQGKRLSASVGGEGFRTVNVPLTCTSCHLAHKTVDTSDPRLKFVDAPTAQKACDTCHNAAGD